MKGDQMEYDLLRSAKHGKLRVGKRFLIKYLMDGKKLSWGQAIKAKCYDCAGMGESGKCDLQTCSLFPYSPYRPRAVRKASLSSGGM